MNFIKILGLATIVGTAACGVLQSVWKFDHTICSQNQEEISKRISEKVRRYREEHTEKVFDEERNKQLTRQFTEETLREIRERQDETFKNRFRRKR